MAAIDGLVLDALVRGQHDRAALHRAVAHLLAARGSDEHPPGDKPS